MKQVTIIDYGSGNIHSIAKAFEKAANNKYKIVVSNKASEITNTNYIVLPGVGAFADCMAGIKKLAGLHEALEQSVINDKKPFLGVCVGMQMLANTSHEHGTHKGLGWIKGNVLPIKTSNNKLKIPHMGWNQLIINNEHKITSGINPNDHVYFVHSYYFSCNSNKNIVAQVEYEEKLPAIIAQENIVATQFHPEKSQDVGIKIISNFLEM